ncbi:FecR family protein [Paenochrobactrum sp. BZR 588]|uniref:FecR family protein n=1 Tax=unclassified Paenochrobactrum TaxID=2639760 RepID=UPI003851F8B5
MDESKQHQDILLDEAVDLIIRLQNDPENPVTAEMINAWCGRSALHEQTWRRIEKLYGASGQVLNYQRRAERYTVMSRRNVLLAGLLFLGGGTFLYTAGPSILMRQRADYITAKGEIRHIRLEDQSQVTLGPDSAIAVEYVQSQRVVKLLAGMAYFEVTRDTQRSFTVYSDNTQITALGTAFEVSNDAGIITVGVDHGLVEARASGELSMGERLQQGQWLVFDPARQTVERSERSANQIASWRDNYLIAEQEQLSSLVARIGRWHNGRIVIADPSIGRKRISGIFDLSNPLVALEAVVNPAGGKVYQLTSTLTIISPL